MGSDIARIHRGKFAGLFQQLPFPCRCAVSAQLLSVCFLLTDNNRHCADGGEEATFASASASSEEEHDHDHDHEHAEKASSTASSAASSTMAISTKLTATESGNSTSSSTTTSASSSLPTAVSACHTHGETELFCMAGRDEWEVISEWDAENPPKSFDSCHAHGEEL
jgi:hypothetical protein